MSHYIHKCIMIVFASAIFLLMFTNRVFALGNSTWKIYYPHYNLISTLDEVMPDKKFTITFSHDINYSELSKSSIEIYNSSMGNKINFTYKALSLNKIEISPEQPLDYGQVYYIIVHNDIKNKYNISMKTGAVCEIKIISNEHLSFLNSIKDGAEETFKQYNIFPSVTMAQAILESRWGQSDKAVKCNNVFGIKAGVNWTGPTMELPTKEYVNGKYIDTTALWRVYSNIGDSIMDHGVFLQKSNYVNSGVLTASNYVEQSNALYKGGYATDPLYAQKICSTINRLDLWKYDPQGTKIAYTAK